MFCVAALGIKHTGHRPDAPARSGDLQLPRRQQRRARQEFFAALSRRRHGESGNKAGATLRYRQHRLLSGAQPRHGDENRRRVLLGKGDGEKLRAVGRRSRVGQASCSRPGARSGGENHRRSGENRNHTSRCRKGSCPDPATLGKDLRPLSKLNSDTRPTRVPGAALPASELLQNVPNRASYRAKHAKSALSVIVESTSYVFSVRVITSTPPASTNSIFGFN